MSRWLVLGLLLVPTGCVPDRAPVQGPQGALPGGAAARPRAAQSAALAARDFTAVDRHALRAPAVAERSLDALAAYLAAPARDDADKARVIYRWITDRIAYDADAYFSGRFRNTQRAPEDVLRHRLAVCDGYAGLFLALSRRMGLEAVTISGHAKGFGYRAGQALAGPADHAWNAVRLSGRWYLLDATWGAGTLDAKTHAFRRHFEPLYFLTPPERFVYRHLPEQPEWQLLPRPLTAGQFVALPLTWPAFFRDGLALVGPSEGAIRTAGELTLRIQAPPQVRLTAKLLRDGREVAGGPTFAQRDGSAVQIHVRVPRAGNYALQVLSKAEPAERTYESALELRLLASAGLGGGAGFPEPYRPFAEHEGRLEAPLRGRLPAGSTQRFRLRIPGAERVVAAVNGQLVELAARGGAFEGDVRMPRGELILYARFPGAESYAGLLRFQGY
ncbi:MAG TPA: transglutaminase domain-containing protein [bacterium]|nr:transglutaminase domain-containing protein [bacterium]